MRHCHRYPSKKTSRHIPTPPRLRPFLRLPPLHPLPPLPLLTPLLSLFPRPLFPCPGLDVSPGPIVPLILWKRFPLFHFQELLNPGHAVLRILFILKKHLPLKTAPRSLLPLPTLPHLSLRPSSPRSSLSLPVFLLFLFQEIHSLPLQPLPLFL